VYKRLYIVIFASIFLAAILLRYWDYSRRYGIGADGSRDAIVSFEARRQMQLPLTGSFSSIGPITFGPWYYYYLTLSDFIIPSIWAPWMAVGLASVFMVLVMYKIGKYLEGKWFGLLLASLATFSPAQISASTLLQQHALIGFLSSLAIFLLIKIISAKKYTKLSLLWGLVIGIAMNIHFQAVTLLTLPILLFIFSKKRSFIVHFLIGIFISMVPILIFELNNHWFNSRHIIDYIFIGQYRVWTSNRWLTFIGKFFPEFWSFVIGTVPVVSLLIMLSFAILITNNFFRKKISFAFIIICLSFFIQLVMLRYYRGEKFFGYLQFFHPYIFIFTGYVIWTILRKIDKPIITKICLVIFICLILPNRLKYLSADKFNLETRARFDTLKKFYPQERFAIYECNKVYDRERNQALVLFLAMHKLYDERGVKISIFNPACENKNSKHLSGDLADINNVSSDQFANSGFTLLSPHIIFNDTARWWFKEQP